MNKKVNKKEVIYDDREDIEISEVANQKNDSQIILLPVLIIIFFLVLGCSLLFINSYYQNKLNDEESKEVIKINNKKNNIFITNNELIKQKIVNESFKNNKDITIEKINFIELVTANDANESGTITFDIDYEIIKNDFENNVFATNDSDVLVRFSYSYNKNDWTYINNVISTNNSTLSPLMGNYYDIAGLKTNLNIVTNLELNSEPGESKIMYWRSETIFKYNKNKKFDNEYEAKFKIEYNSNK